MELSDIRTALRRYWFLYLLAMVFWLGLGALLAYGPASEYRATATVVASPPADLQGNPAQFVSFHIPTIVATVESRSFRAEVRDTLDDDVARSSVSMSAASELGTGIIKISAQGTDRAALPVWATAYAEAIIAEQEEEQLDLRLLDPAARPETPVSPQRTSTMFGATAMGLITGLLLCVAAFRIRKALDFDEEVQRRLGLPVIGRIPSSRALRRTAGDAATAILSGPPEVVEAFQSLRTSLALALPSTARNVVAVASWAESEGKSTVAAGVALTLANSGTDVVAVDADLRRPQLHVILGQPFGAGVADVAKRGLDGLVRPTGRPRLWFLPAGIPDRHPTDVITESMPIIVGSLPAADRRVVVDAPPFNGIAETPMILAAAGGVLLVVDSRRSRLPELERMVSSLRGSGVHFLGVVLNRVSRSRRQRSYSSYTATWPTRPPDESEIRPPRASTERSGPSGQRSPDR